MGEFYRWMDPPSREGAYARGLERHRALESQKRSRCSPLYKLAMFSRNMVLLRQSHCECGTTQAQCLANPICCLQCDHVSDHEKLRLSLKRSIETLYKPQQVIDVVEFIDLPQDLIDLLNTLDTAERIHRLFHDVTDRSHRT